MTEEELKEQFVRSLKIGIGATESTNITNAKNPHSTASGKYQFTEGWMDNNQKGVDSIRSFYRKNQKALGASKDPKDLTLEDFKNNPHLQELYFNHYAKNFVYPKALEISKGPNPRNIPFEGIAALVHFKGAGNAAREKGKKYTGAAYQIRTGDFDKEVVYGVDGAKENNSSSLGYIKKTLGVMEKAGALIPKEAIMDITPEGKKIKEDIIKEFDERTEAINKMDGSVGEKEALRAEQYKELVRKGDHEIVNQHIRSKNEIIAKKQKEEKTESDFQKMEEDMESLIAGKDKKKTSERDIAFQKDKTRVRQPSIDKNLNKTVQEPLEFLVEINPNIVPSGEVNKVDLTEDEPAVAVADTPKTTDKTEEVTEAKEASDTVLIDDYVKGLAGPPQKEYAGLGESKMELPFDAVVGMGLNLIGNDIAKKAKIPLRTEQVSEAMKNYAADLKRKSIDGMPVEIEAMLKNQLAESYQGGLSNIANMSEGNSATVMGNIGQLETAKNRGLIDIQKADYEAKDRAFAQYGQAITYMNDFDARRDIANHGIKYQEAKERQVYGQELQGAGLAKVVEDIKYQRDNGPGSANALYKSMLMQNMYGFDPNLKDNGLGDTKGTKSWYDKQKGVLDADIQRSSRLKKSISGLNAPQRAKVQEMLALTSETGQIEAFTSYLHANPGADLASMTMDNFDLAFKKGNDFSVLSKDRKDIIGGDVTKVPVNTSPIEPLVSPLVKPPVVSEMNKPTAIPNLATPNFNPVPAAQGLGIAGINPALEESLNQMNDHYANN